jgi:chaperonin GroEL
VEAIGQQAVAVTTRDEVIQVATISGHDPEIGELVGGAMADLGKDGVITIQDGQTMGLEVETQTGMRFERRGYLSRHFVTDPVTREAVLEDAYILMYGGTIEQSEELIPALERLAQAGERSLLVIADNVRNSPLAMLAANARRGHFRCVAIRAPGLGVTRIEMMEDLAAFVGGSVISDRAGKRLDRVTLQDFGRADRVVTNWDTTTILGGRGSKEDVETRVAQLRQDIEATYVKYEGKFDRDALQNRLGQLTSGVGIVSVGAPTRAERDERKLRVEDAAAATKAALEEGIVPGGGVALLNVIPALSGVVSDIPDEEVGITVLRLALEEPTRRLAENAGYNGRVVMEEIRRRQAESGDSMLGFDVLNGDYGNLVERGIIDPAKVTRTAVENAVSVATLILSTEALVADLPEEG